MSIKGGIAANVRHFYESNITGYVFHPSSQFVAVGYTDGNIEIVDRTTDKCKRCIYLKKILWAQSEVCLCERGLMHSRNEFVFA